VEVLEREGRAVINQMPLSSFQGLKEKTSDSQNNSPKKKECNSSSLQRGLGGEGE